VEESSKRLGLTCEETNINKRL